MKARTLALYGSIALGLILAAIAAVLTYYGMSYFIDGFGYMPLIEGSNPPVLWQPRIFNGQLLSGALAALIVGSVLVLSMQLIRKSRNRAL